MIVFKYIRCFSRWKSMVKIGPCFSVFIISSVLKSSPTPLAEMQLKLRHSLHHMSQMAVDSHCCASLLNPWGLSNTTQDQFLCGGACQPRPFLMEFWQTVDGSSALSDPRPLLDLFPFLEDTTFHCFVFLGVFCPLLAQFPHFSKDTLHIMVRYAMFS